MAAENPKRDGIVRWPDLQRTAWPEERGAAQLQPGKCSLVAGENTVQQQENTVQQQGKTAQRRGNEQRRVWFSLKIAVISHLAYNDMLKKLYLLWKDRHFWGLRKKTAEEIFSNVYEKNVWGGEPGSLYSGTGTASESTKVYIEFLRRFISEHNIRSVLDIGCGDFRIMSQVVSGLDVQYTGGDVVQKVVDFNNTTHGSANIAFIKLNAINENLPDAELVTIRQVLQHLNNEQIGIILGKLKKFKRVIITEHLPITQDVEYNLDKIAGPHIRMRVNSGVFIDKPPFNVENAKIVLEYREDDPVKGKMVPAVIRTYLIENS